MNTQCPRCGRLNETFIEQTFKRKTPPGGSDSALSPSGNPYLAIECECGYEGPAAASATPPVPRGSVLVEACDS